MAGKKKMTNREKQERAAAKKRLQEKGIIPPDKPRLNRKKFIDEAVKEWEDEEMSGAWGLYLVRAVRWMLGHGDAGKVSPEAVGAAKVLKIAVRMHRFDTELREKGQDEYKVSEMYEYIKDIMNA